MGRLISEDDVMRMFTSVELNNGTITDAKSELRNVKTAYSIERVVAELEEETECPNCSMYCADAHICGFDEMRKQAIEIVKRGGVE